MAQTRQPPGGPKGFKVTLPPLDAGPVPLHSIREQARRGLLDMIDSRGGGRKALILDRTLVGPLSALDTSVTELLAEHGISRIQYVEPRPLDDANFGPQGLDARLGDARAVIWLVRANVLAAQRAATHAKALRSARAASGGPPLDFCVCFVPRRTIACNRVLEEEGMWGDIAISDWDLELLPIEEDVLSLELDGAFKECVLEGDSSSLYATARALVRLQAMWGLIPRLQGKGPAATAVRDMMLRTWRENPDLAEAAAASDAAGGAPLISQMILIDREVDMVTPCMTQITLEGLIDEVTGIKGGTVPWAPKGGTTALLNSTDPYFKELRDLPYHVAITRLQAAAREARREYEVLSSKDLAQLKTFVKGLPKLMLLDRLSDIASPVAEQVRQQLFHDRLKHELDAVEGVDQDAGLAFIQELIYRGAGLLDVLRLLVLFSVTGHGLPRRALDALREELMVAYGHEHMLTLAALDKAGLLQVATSSRSPFQMVRRVLRLVVPEPDGATPDTPPTDISHIYRGYAPLSIRLVEIALSAGSWGKPGSALADALLLLPGGAFDMPQQMPGATRGGGATNGEATGKGQGRGTVAVPDGFAAGSADVAGGIVLVVFLGGVTFSEISCLRWLGSRLNKSFLILTTQVLNGKTLLAGFVDPLISAGALLQRW